MDTSTLSIQTKNRIYAEVAPKKKNRIYGMGSLKNEASSAHRGTPPPPTDDPVLAQKLAKAEVALATQAAELKVTTEKLQITTDKLQLQITTEKVHSFDVFFDYLAEKDPDFAAKFGNRTTPSTEQGNQSTPASASASASPTGTWTESVSQTI